MEPTNNMIDPLARIISYTGLGIALIVGVIHFLNYFRGRWQNPIIHVHSHNENPIIISKPYLVLFRLYIDNPSTLPNTIIGLSCKTRLNWYKNCLLKTGNLNLFFVDIPTKEGEHTSDLRLEIAQQVELDDDDWKSILDPILGSPLQEGLWKLPLMISARSTYEIIIALSSDLAKINKAKKFRFTFTDITQKNHTCIVRLK